jgi:hypothetical protein
MFGTLFGISTLVMLSPISLGIVRPDWFDCTIDGIPWDPDMDATCPYFDFGSDVFGNLASVMFDDVDMIYWRIVPLSDWEEVDEFYPTYTYVYTFEFEVDIEQLGGGARLELWGDGDTYDYYGHCNM